MRLTQAVADLEATYALMLQREHAWHVWADTSTTRKPHRPTLIALHTTGLTLAVYTRPRALKPSEHPDTTQLPDSWTPVVWTPQLERTVRHWARMPTSPPPGLITPKDPTP